MKNKIGEIFFGRNTKLSGLLALSIVMLISLGCLCDKKPGSVPAAYLGDWQGQDGTTISLRGDGSGDYKSGSSNVTNGAAEVNEAEKTLSIKFVGMGKTFKIDQAPTGSQMTLDGMVFRRKGGFSDPAGSNTSTSNSTISSPTNKSPFGSDDNSTTSSQDGLPSSVEVETLVKSTMSDFTSAIEDDDFSNFRLHASKDFQATLSDDQVKSQFQVFVDKKDSVLPSLRQTDETATDFSEKPYIRTEKGYKILVANGSFPTSSKTISFETEYELENGKWKLLSFKVKT